MSLDCVGSNSFFVGEEWWIGDNMRIVEDNCLIILDDDKNEILRIAEELDDGTMYIELSGDINMKVSHEFEDELNTVLSVCSNIVVDFSELKSISSAALSALLAAQKKLDTKKNSSFVLYGVTGSVREVFKSTGFIDLFEIAE